MLWVCWVDGLASIVRPVSCTHCDLTRMADTRTQGSGIKWPLQRLFYLQATQRASVVVHCGLGGGPASAMQHTKIRHSNGTVINCLSPAPPIVPPRL